MNTLKLHASDQWINQASTKKDITIWNQITAFADGEAKHRTLWFMVALIVQGVFFLPIPAVLLFYFNAPMICLVITLTMFFASIVLGAGGASIRMLLAFFALSIVLHLAMLAIFIL